jgi:hypothetical protein
VLTPNVELDPVGTDRICSEHGTVQDEMGSVGHEHPILDALGFTFRAVRHDDGNGVPALGDGAPLAPDGEPGPAPTQEPGLIKVDDDGRRRSVRGQRPETIKVRPERLGVAVEGRPCEQTGKRCG